MRNQTIALLSGGLDGTLAVSIPWLPEKGTHNRHNSGIPFQRSQNILNILPGYPIFHGKIEVLDTFLLGRFPVFVAPRV